MEVIGHKHKFMQQIFALPAAVLQNFNEELRHSLRLKQAPLLKSGSGDEVDAVSCVAAGRNSHQAPQRTQPLRRSADCLREFQRVRVAWRSAFSAAVQTVSLTGFRR